MLQYLICKYCLIQIRSFYNRLSTDGLATNQKSEIIEYPNLLRNRLSRVLFSLFVCSSTGQAVEHGLLTSIIINKIKRTKMSENKFINNKK